MGTAAAVGKGHRSRSWLRFLMRSIQLALIIIGFCLVACCVASGWKSPATDVLEDSDAIAEELAEIKIAPALQLIEEPVHNKPAVLSEDADIPYLTTPAEQHAEIKTKI